MAQQGTVLNVSATQGIITGDDGMRYTFGPAGMRDPQTAPYAGMRVEFEVQGSEAVDVHAVGVDPSAGNVSASPYGAVSPPGYEQQGQQYPQQPYSPYGQVPGAYPPEGGGKGSRWWIWLIVAVVVVLLLVFVVPAVMLTFYVMSELSPAKGILINDVGGMDARHVAATLVVGHASDVGPSSRVLATSAPLPAASGEGLDLEFDNSIYGEPWKLKVVESLRPVSALPEKIT